MKSPRLPRLLFVGFHGAPDGSSPQSQNELVAALLRQNGFDVRSGSRRVNQLVRLGDQLLLTLRNVRWADAVVVDVFSGRRAWTPFLLARLVRRAGLPLVLVLHGGGLPEYVQRRSWQIDSTLRLASVLVAPSAYLQRVFEARGFTVLRIPNLVDLELDDGPTVPRLASGRVLWMRAFDVEYRPALAVEVFSLLAKVRSGVSLTMAGPDRGQLEQARAAAQRTGVADLVSFPGYLDSSAKRLAFREHDVFLNTTAIDNTPVSVLEAMAAGVPVVASDVGGLTDLLDGGKAGLLVKDGDPAEMASALVRVLDDDALRARLQRAGREVARNYRPEAVVSGWAAALTRTGVRSAPAQLDGIGPLALSDLGQIAEIHQAAFPASFITQLGERVIRAYYRWQFTGPHPVPYAVGVWRGGVLVGFVFGGSRSRAVSGFARASLGTIGVGAVTHPRALRSVAVPKMASVARLMVGSGTRPSPPADLAPAAAGPPDVEEPRGPSFGILSIALRPDRQGSGAADELMEHARAAAVEGGFAQMNLTVQVDNGRAIAFYEKWGWERVPQDGAWTGAMRLPLATE